MSYSGNRYPEYRSATLPQVFAEFRALVESHTAFSIAVTAGLAAIYSIWDMLMGALSQLIPQLVIYVAGQYFVVERLLSDRLPDGRGSRRFRSVFGSGVLSGLGIILGLALLVLPGLFLLGRWSITTQLIIAEDLGSVRSLSESWERTERSSGQLFLVYLVAGAVYLVGVSVASMLAEAAGQEGSLYETILSNLAAAALTLLGWTLSTAIFRCLVPCETGLEEVFA